MTDAKLIIVDDDGDATVSLARALRATELPAQIHAVSTEKSALDFISREKPHAAVFDLSLNEHEGVESGFRLLRHALEITPTLRVIVLTGHADSAHGIRALNMGAASFLEKPADVLHLSALIQDGVRQCYLRRSYELLIEHPQDLISSLLIGASPAWQRVGEEVAFAAKTNQPVLIVGETGTGKGLCASVIHRLSSRSSGKFVRYQTAFSSSDIVNSDLFGHKKGAFTGAVENRDGLIKESHFGTLFHDEVNELPLETQIALLGVLQERRYRSLGSDDEREVNLRLICASSRDMALEIEARKVRRDFYHRIAHFVIELPPLRERREDISLLAQHTLERLCGEGEMRLLEISEDALALLNMHTWPGNVRELESAIESAAYRAKHRGSARIQKRDLSLGPVSSQHASAGKFHDRVAAFKKDLIARKLAETGGNQAQSARELGLDRTTLRRMLSL